MCTLIMFQYKSPKQFNPFTIVIKLMQATNNKTKPLLFFSHAISLSTKHLLAKNSHQINEPHITQTASIFCHNKNQFQTLSLVGTYSISLEFRKEPSTRGSSSLCQRKGTKIYVFKRRGKACHFEFLPRTKISFNSSPLLFIYACNCLFFASTFS